MADVRLEPMTDADYSAFAAAAEDDYAKQIAESGSMSWEAAVEKSAADFAVQLPRGLQSPDQHLYTAFAADTAVGVFWLRVETTAELRKAFINDIAVYEAFRRQGYGRAIMLAGEDAARSLGATVIGLNVWGGNVGARALYEQIGYETLSVQMQKRL
jgi:ribosomal protein S18 acetylase RimI-like enzyme